MLADNASDGESVERLWLETGEPLAKWTGTVLTYLHADHLGTPRRGTHGLGTQDDTSGNPASPGAEVFADFSTPFGMSPTPAWHGDAGSGFDPATGPGSNCGVTGFTTHVRDCQTGLEYMQARYYDSVSGRFTSNDPVGFLTDGRTGMVNRYSYTLNDPVNGVDPDGKVTIHINRGVGGPRIPFLSDQNVGSVGASAGVAISFPVPFLDPNANFDAGIVGTIKASGKGSRSIGTGKFDIGLELTKGSVKDLDGSGTELSIKAPITFIPIGPVLVPNPVGPSIGGLITRDEEGSIDGVGVSAGFGTEVSGSKTLTGTASLRDLLIDETEDAVETVRPRPDRFGSSTTGSRLRR
ncbi:MAG: RHS repeat-associated core domain-containing protein [Litorimonas sp.]